MSLLSVIGGWGGVLPPHFGQKKKQETFFQISCSVCRCVGGGYLVVKVQDKLTRYFAHKLDLPASAKQLINQIWFSNYRLHDTLQSTF